MIENFREFASWILYAGVVDIVNGLRFQCYLVCSHDCLCYRYPLVIDPNILSACTG